jgi:hypothetical protein
MRSLNTTYVNFKIQRVNVRDFMSLTEKLTVAQLAKEFPICTLLRVIHLSKNIPEIQHSFVWVALRRCQYRLMVR